MTRIHIAAFLSVNPVSTIVTAATESVNYPHTTATFGERPPSLPMDCGRIVAHSESRQLGSYVVSDQPLSPDESSVPSPVWSTDLIPVDGCCSKRPDTLRQSA